MLKPALALLMALLAGFAATPAAAADVLIDNVNGIRVGDDGALHRFSGLLIRDGRVAALIEPGAAKPRAQATVDGRGRTLLPGLVDAHGHVVGLGLALTRLDVSGTSSLNELQQRLRDYATTNPKLEWITGRGWNQELWPGKRFPSASDLDAIVADRPVMLERVDGHAAVVNSAALRAAGITAATQDPTGGKIERDARGNPTGLLIDAAAALVEAKVPPTSPAQKRDALLAAQTMLLQNGLTAVADMGTSTDDWNAMRQLGDANGLEIRIMAYAHGLEHLFNVARTEPTPWLYGDRLRMGGVKLYADGALGSRGALLKQDYADAHTRGLALLSEEELRQQAGAAAAAGFQVAVHAIGDAANAMALDVLEGIDRTHSPGFVRSRIEHAQVVDPKDIPRFGRRGIIASMQPVHQTSDRTMAEARLGPDRLRGAYAWRSIEQTVGRLVFGSDFPVEHPNPFHGLAAAISRQDPEGQPPGGWRPEERVSFETALGGFTRQAAWAGFGEGRFGALAIGEWADFILVDRDVSKAGPQELAATQVLETWIAGRKVWDRFAKPPTRGND